GLPTVLPAVFLTRPLAAVALASAFFWAAGFFASGICGLPWISMFCPQVSAALPSKRAGARQGILPGTGGGLLETRSGQSLPEGVLYLLPGLAQAAAGLVTAALGLHRPVAGQPAEGPLDPAAGLGVLGGRLALGPLAVSRGGPSHIRHRITL